MLTYCFSLFLVNLPNISVPLPQLEMSVMVLEMTLAFTMTLAHVEIAMQYRYHGIKSLIISLPQQDRKVQGSG